MGHLVIRIAEEAMNRFISLLQSGVTVETSTDESILTTVQKLEGFTEQYIADEVQTIFVDGTAIDDIFALIDKDTRVIALSAAMPGLSGAIYRRNSIHAALRSVQQEAGKHGEAAVPVTLSIKLFNAIARDRGPELLQRGITMDAESLLNFFNVREWISHYISALWLDNQQVPLDNLVNVVDQEQKITLQVVSIG